LKEAQNDGRFEEGALMTRIEAPGGETSVPEVASADSPAAVESLNARRRAQDRRETPARRQVPAEDLDLIVRRAAGLQNKRGNPGSQLLTEEEVVEIGRQVGLEPDHVRRAMAEVHAESLAPKRPPGNRTLDLIAGEARVEVRRVVAGDPALIQQQIEMQLRDREKLSALRRRRWRSVWEASTGTMDRLERFLNFSGREYALAETRQVELAVAETEPGWSLVTIAADIDNKRDEAVYGAAGGVALVAILAAVLAGQSGYPVALAAGAGLLAALLGAAVGVTWVRRVLDKRRGRVALILESLVDLVDR
jgi:hypothetical protein